MSKVQLNTLCAGDCFGEYSLIDQNPISASVVATEAGELIQITKPAFDAVLQANDRIAKTVYLGSSQGAQLEVYTLPSLLDAIQQP